MAIPKIIHYCWFGFNSKSELINKCIDSWKKYCPDYEIQEWNENNFDINCCQYVKEAYEKKKWAFVSDYCRFYALNKFGGIYLDTDVELIKPIDNLLENPFMGFESEKLLNPGLICACYKDNWLCILSLDEYNNDKFILIDGKINYRTICERTTDIMVNNGLKQNNSFQKIKDYNIFPKEYFNPYDSINQKFDITSNTYSIHHFAGSWTDDNYYKETSNINGKIFIFIKKIFGEKFAIRLRKLIIKLKN